MKGRNFAVRIVLRLLTGFVIFWACSVSVSAQVSITYSEVEEVISVPVKEDSIPTTQLSTDPSVSPHQMNKDQRDNDNVNEQSLSYAWVDFDFVLKSVPYFKALVDDYEAVLKEKTRTANSEINSTQSTTERQRISNEMQKWATDYHKEFLSNLVSCCLNASISIGIIPLNTGYKSYVTGKLSNIPDVTWDLILAVKKTQITPYNEALPYHPNLQVAYVDSDLLLEYILSDVNSVLKSSINWNDYQIRRFQEEYASLMKPIADKIETTIEAKGNSMGYDGVITISSANKAFLVPAILEQMDDITYSVVQDLKEKFSTDYDFAKLMKLCQEFSNI